LGMFDRKMKNKMSTCLLCMLPYDLSRACNSFVHFEFPSSLAS
jgi:hypothetical protein